MFLYASVLLSRNANIVLTKKPDPVKNKYNYLQLSQASISLLTEDLKNAHLENDNLPSARLDKTNRGRLCDSKFFSYHSFSFMYVNDCLIDASLNVTRMAGRLNISENPPTIPLLGESAIYWLHRKSLPIFQYRQEILNQIDHKQVVVIAGDVGSGKTTQVPQYILENAFEKNVPCRIVSVQPRRISVYAAVDRVTAERGKVIVHS